MWQFCDKSVILHWVCCKQYKEGIVLTSPHVVCLPRTLKLAGRVQSKLGKSEGEKEKVVERVKTEGGQRDSQNEAVRFVGKQ